MATISQRISLEGSEDIRRQLLALGVAGERAFKQIQDAAAKPIGDPAQVNKTKQALDGLVAASAKLGPQLQTVSTAADKAGTSLQTVADSSSLAAVGMIAVGTAIGTGLVAAFTKVKSLIESFSFSELTKGAVETAQQLQAQADKVNLSIEQWLQLRRALQSTSMSWDEAASGLAKLGQVIDNSLIAKFRDVTVQTENGAATIRIINGVISSTATISGRAAAALRELGVSTTTIATGDKLAIMREVAVAIDKIPNAAERADRGLRVFGRNWEDLIKSLIASKNALEANRDLMPEQVAQLKKLGDAWSTLGTAVRAVKDQIGLLFAGPATARAEWLTTIADGVRKLVIDFSKLTEAKQELFLGALGGSPAETAFKILIAVGQQLAGIWNQILVPAGQKLVSIARNIASSFQGVSGTQVAAFFITAATAAAALAIALKGIALVLSPIAALFSLAFSPLGIILIGAAALVVAFWDQFKAVAQAALALIPQELQQMKTAFAQLFQGNFSGFWNNFSAAAVSAFQKIKDAALQTEFGQSIKKSIENVIGAFGLLKTAADGVAAGINRVFRTELKGADIGILAVIGQTTGAFDLLRNAVGITGIAITTFVGTMGGLANTIGGLPLLLGTLAIGLTGFIVYLDPTIWDTWKNTATNAINAVKGLIAEFRLGTVGQDLNPLVWDIFANAALFAINRIMAAIRGLTALINGFTSAIQNMRQMQAPGAPLPEPGGTPMARGGLLGGRGTGTSDSNLAWLSRGEHVMPARAVRQPGVLAFLEALRRSGGNLRGILDDMGHFARGGLVRLPAFAAGGLNSGGNNVTIQFPGLPPVTGLRASSQAVDELHKAAALAQVRSGGRKPSRYS